MLDDGELLQVFKKCKDLGAYVTTLAENGHIVDKVSLSDLHKLLNFTSTIQQYRSQYINFLCSPVNHVVGFLVE